jgi:hypothetical protein
MSYWMVPHFDISTWLFTVVPGSMRDVKNQLQDLDGRTWLGTGYILPFVLFFFHLIFSSVSVILPQIRLGILECHPADPCLP